MDGDTVISHPGATFGGIVHNGALAGCVMANALTTIKTHYRQAGFNFLLYKAVPDYYRWRPCADDLYALYHTGAEQTTAKLSAVINLNHRGLVSKRRRRGIKKASNAGIKIAQGIQYAPLVWDLVKENLLTRHNTQPIHSLEEIEYLAKTFPSEITFHVALLDNAPICAVVLFATQTLWHAQYIAANDIGRNNGALDFLFEHLITQATANNLCYFSFGTSNEPMSKGGKLNEGLYKFKQEFGAGGHVHFFYKLSLK